MKRTIVALALLALPATTAAAQAIGPFTPDTPLEAVIAAHPAFDWSSRIGDDGGADALAARPLRFADLDWEVALSRSPGTRYALSLSTFDEQARSRDGCFDRFARVVAALEPAYGPFGRHPAFARGNNPLYGFAFSMPGEAEGPGFRLREAGADSLAREDLAWPAFVTFVEVDPAAGETVAVNATFTDADSADGKALNLTSGCTLRIEAFQSDERAARVRALEAP